MSLSPARVQKLRANLRLPDEVLAVNAGTWGPVCRASDEAVDAFRRAAPSGRLDWEQWAGKVLGALGEDRAAVAQVLGCQAAEIALCESTTAAMNVFLWGLELSAGDEIIYGNLENPAALVPLWVIAQRKGLKLVEADLGNGERDAVQAVRSVVTPRTKVVLLSDVTFATGARVDLAGVAALAHAHGALVLVDGVQAVGTVPIDVKALGVDAYAVARHKFMCGPDGAGALYVSSTIMERIAPTFSGACSDRAHGGGGGFLPMPNAERYELSTRAIDAYVGGTAALKWFIGEVGPEHAFARIAQLKRELWQNLSRVRGVHLLSPHDPPGALLTFHVDGVAAGDVVSRLKPYRVDARTIEITKPAAVRLSVGFWNRDEDPGAIAEAVERVTRAAPASPMRS